MRLYLKSFCMAKQIGPLFITGTIDNITFYQLEGIYYARKKSSLSGRRVKTHSHFKRTMENAFRLADASKIASAVYRLIPKSERQHKMYRVLTGAAMDLLKQGSTKEEALEFLCKESKELKEKKEINEGNKLKEKRETKESKEQKQKKEIIECRERKKEKRFVVRRFVAGENMEVEVINPVYKKQVEELVHKEFVVPWFSKN